jgi:L-ascorbate metabolism protein UlaG (beta-lactamase superfamily)
MEKSGRSKTMTARVCALAVFAVLAAAVTGGCPRAGMPRSSAPRRHPKSAAPAAKEEKPMAPGVTVQYYGQACFVVSDSQGTRVAIDPYGAGVGYKVPALAADICLVTHEHFDHNNTEAVGGAPEIMRTPGKREVKGLSLLGVEASHHPPGQHTERGDVIMYKWVMDGIALLHCGDLGAPLNTDQIAALGKIDILLVPVGGFYTIDAGQAVQVVQDLKPEVVIPMHFRTEASASKMSQIAPVDAFLQTIPSAWVLTKSQVNSVTIPKSELEKPGAPVRVIVLNYR